MPINVTISETGNIYSPYQDEIDKLLEKGNHGLNPIEVEHLNKLIDKNNQWHANHYTGFVNSIPNYPLNIWKKKTNYLIPLIILLWGIYFYYFYKKTKDNRTLSILVMPIVLSIFQIMTLIEVLLISLTILAIWFYIKFINNKHGISGVR